MVRESSAARKIPAEKFRHVKETTRPELRTIDGGKMPATEGNERSQLLDDVGNERIQADLARKRIEQADNNRDITNQEKLDQEELYNERLKELNAQWEKNEMLEIKKNAYSARPSSVIQPGERISTWSYEQALQMPSEALQKLLADKYFIFVDKNGKERKPKMKESLKYLFNKGKALPRDHFVDLAIGEIQRRKKESEQHRETVAKAATAAYNKPPQKKGFFSKLFGRS